MRSRDTQLVFLGGALGSILRAVLSDYSASSLAILVINFLGSVLLGFVHSHAWFRPESRQLFWATGFCGGFTTLSAIDLMLALTPSWTSVGFAVLNLSLGVGGYAIANALGRRFAKAGAA